MLRRLLLPAVIVLLAPASVNAQAPLPVQLEWRAPQECPSGTEVLSATARLLETAGPLEGFETMRFVATIEGADDEWRADIRTGDAEPRVIEASSCDQLVDATAMIIALAVNAAMLEEPEPYPEPELPPVEVREEAAAVPSEAHRPVPVEPTEGSPRWQLLLRADGRLDLGTMDTASGALRLVVGAELEWWRLEGWVSYWFPRRIQANGETPRGGDFQIVTGGLETCLAPVTGVIEVAGCAGLELGEISGTGYGVTNPRTARALLVTVLAGLAAAWNPMDNLGVRLGVGLGLNPLRPVFELDPYGAVHQPSLVVARFWIGVEARLP